MAPFKQRLEEFEKFTPRKLKTKAKNRTVYNNVRNIYYKLLSIYYDDYKDNTDEEKEKMGEKYDPKNLLLKFENLLNRRKKKKLNHCQKKLLLKE